MIWKAEKKAKPLRVYVTDEEPLFIEGIRRRIEAEENQYELLPAGTVNDGNQAWRDISELKPEIAIIGVDLEGISGIEVSRRITDAELPTKIICVNATTQPEMAHEAIVAGASAYLLKTADWDEVKQAMTTVMSGGTAMTPTVLSILAGELIRRGGEQIEELTEKERDALILLASGKRVTQIAESLHVAPDTAKGYLKNIYEKLGVRSQAAAVATAFRHGIIDGD